MTSFIQVCWLIIAQAAPPAAAASETATKAADDAPKGGLFDNMLMFLPLMLMIMFVYMLLMGKPKQEANRDTSELLKNLKKNDRVVTAGGIMGTVVNNRQDVDHLTIRIDDSSGAKMQVLKQSIIRVINDEEKSGK